MEKINVVQLLKDCPSGMELDCTMFEGVEFDGIVDNEYLPIRCRIKNPAGGYNVYHFTKYGCWDSDCNAKCVIFPKGKTSWEGFVPPCQFKVGNWYQCTKDLFFGTCVKCITFDKNAVYYCAQEGRLQDKYGRHIAINKDLYDNFKLWTIQDAKEETKTLDELPKFKNGDITITIQIR